MALAWDITKLMVCISVAISLLNGMAVFSMDYMTAPDVTSYNVTEMRNSFGPTDEPGVMDAFSTVGFIVQGLGMMASILLNFVGLFDTMVTIFNVPPLIAGAISGIIGMVWASFIVQLLMRFNWGGIED